MYYVEVEEMWMNPVGMLGKNPCPLQLTELIIVLESCHQKGLNPIITTNYC